MGRRFCAVCGNQDVPLHDNHCQSCYFRHNQISKVKQPKIEVPYCLTCFAVKVPNGWSRDNETKENMIELISYNFMRNLITAPESSIDIVGHTDVNWINPNPEFDIQYIVRNHEIEIFEIHEEEVQFEVKLMGGICKTCVRRKTGTHDVTVQFRAKDRSLIKTEIDKATTVAFTLAKELYHETSDAYVSDIIDNHGGLDFYLGNDMFAEALVAQFKKVWVGHHEKNYKLITEEKDNKRVYRATHLYRIPGVIPGDYVLFKDELHQVTKTTHTTVKLIEKRGGTVVNVTNWEDLEIVNPLPYEVKKLVISEDMQNESYLLMDLVSYENEEVSTSMFYKALPVSEEISLLIWNDKYYNS